MNELQCLIWIKRNLSAVIAQALIDSNSDYPESLLAGMAMRETGIIISKYGKSEMLIVSALTKGDFTKRPKDKEKTYHGFSFWQIDIDSYPDFVKSGHWKDPYKACRKAIEVLDEKKKYILKKFPLILPDTLLQATIAAYNCGQGNVVKVIAAKKDIDSRTAHGNYSKSVLQYKTVYEGLA